ncbi:hypothetical protein [Stenotrophomonas rhizophila]|uniref:hypothetical protein n=1 Tax=Stenotrophomonas rhizophila TaxID=216778 RepID=UPI003AF9EADB
MTLRRADDILDWLLSRQPDKRIVEKTTGLPYGWGLWLRALTPLPRPFRSTEVIAELIQRPLPGSPGRLPALGFVQSLRRLLWQTWDPAPRDQRWMRWTSAVISVLLHVMFALLLLWVALIRPPVQPEQGGDGGRIQVEFLGSGTPRESGGGEPAAAGSAAAAAAASAQAAAAASQPRPASSTAATAPQPPASAPAPTASTEPAPTPPAPAPTAVEQPVQATDVAEATTDFVVPPTSVPRTEVRVIPRDAPEPQVRERTVEVAEAPTPPSITPSVRPVETQVRPRDVAVREREVTVVTAPTAPVPVPGPRVEVTVPQRDLQVREREVTPAPSVSVTVAPVPQREITVPGRSPEVAVRERAVPNAAPRPAPAAATPSPAASAPSPTPGASTASQASPSRSSAASTAPARAPAARPSPTPGNWATPARGDDWGAADRNRAGERSGAQANQGAGRTGEGLFNADGSVRVPGQAGGGDSERGAPGGENDGWSRERIAQSGTWLKRPPYDYTPTSFDKYWAPNESLLAEWVRKGIKAVEIPIPGTSSKISCVVSILQFGGGCGLSDPNMQDQPAVARPPPDIPFKKELQDDNGSR